MSVAHIRRCFVERLLPDLDANTVRLHGRVDQTRREICNWVCDYKPHLFPDRNLDTSQHSGQRDPAPPLLSAAQARLSFGSGLLRSTHASHQNWSTFNEETEKAPFPKLGSQQVYRGSHLSLGR